MRRTLLLALTLALSAAVAAAQGIVSVDIGNNRASATIELPGGIGADLEIGFEQVIGLSGQSLGLSAELVNVADPNLLSRLPALGSLGIPAGFPVLVSIEPPANGPLSFTGVVTVELHTHNLSYVANSPLRLFASPAGGAFQDITRTIGMGSYRAGGSKGKFSDFLIVADTRAVDDVILAKFQRTQGVLDDNAEAIAPQVAAELQALLDSAAWYWYGAGDVLAAVREVEAFGDTVKEHSGTDIPDVWRSSRDLVNVAGELRAAAATLRFSLNQKASGG